jgi:hypothetical protein
MTMMTPMGQGGRMYPRSRRWPRVVGALLVLAALAAVGAGVWWWLSREDSTAAPTPTATRTCRTPPPVTPRVIPPADKIEVDVANGTDRSGLAIETSDALSDRGFVVVGIGNTERPVKEGVALVRYAASRYAEAIRVASYVPGSQLVAVPKLKGGAVELWLGPDFDGVVSSKEADVEAVTLPTPEPICPKSRTPSG